MLLPLAPFSPGTHTESHVWFVDDERNLGPPPTAGQGDVVH